SAPVPSVHAGAPGRGAVAARTQTAAAAAAGRAAEPAQPPVRLPFPDTLPACDRALRGRDAAAARGRARSLGGVPLRRAGGGAGRARRRGMNPARVLHRLPASTSQHVYSEAADDRGLSNFHLVVTLRVTGRYERGALADALATLTARHEALRTTFERTAEGLDQLVWDTADCPIAEVDLGSEPKRLGADVVAFVNA